MKGGTAAELASRLPAPQHSSGTGTASAERDGQRLQRVSRARVHLVGGMRGQRRQQAPQARAQRQQERSHQHQAAGPQRHAPAAIEQRGCRRLPLGSRRQPCDRRDQIGDQAPLRRRRQPEEQPRQLRARGGAALHEIGLGEVDLLQCLLPVPRQRMQPLEQVSLLDQPLAYRGFIGQALRRIGSRWCRSQAALDGAVEIGQGERAFSARTLASLADSRVSSRWRASTAICSGRGSARSLVSNHDCKLAAGGPEFGMAGNALQPRLELYRVASCRRASSARSRASAACSAAMRDPSSAFSAAIADTRIARLRTQRVPRARPAAPQAAGPGR